MEFTVSGIPDLGEGKRAGRIFKKKLGGTGNRKSFRVDFEVKKGGIKKICLISGIFCRVNLKMAKRYDLKFLFAFFVIANFIIFYKAKILFLMRKLKSILMPVLLAGAGVLYYSFDHTGSPHLHYQQGGAITNYKCTFSVEDTAAHALPGAYYLVFLSTGDGGFFKGRLSDLPGFSYYYQQGITSAPIPFAQLIEVYDDGTPPPAYIKVATNAINVTGSTSWNPHPVTMGTNFIQVDKFCKFVPGDDIVFPVTYQNQCAIPISSPGITFTYPSQLTYVSADLFQAGTASGNTSPVTVTGLPTLAPGEQRTVFLKFKTNSDVAVGSTISGISAKLTGVECGPSGTSGTTSTLPSELAYNSYDPNIKTTLQNDVCGADDEVVWRIDFQNEGNEMEDTVKIYDWIDTLLYFNSVEVIGFKPGFNVDQVVLLPQRREVRFMMNDVQLKGLKQPGVPEDSTKGYMILKARKRLSIPCNTIVNSARILFGWNPPITTAEAYAPMNCDSCAGCTVLLDTIQPQLTIALDSQQLLPSGSLPGWLSTGPWTYKWYPADGLDNPFALDAKIVFRTKRVYTLVASLAASNCQRVIIHVPVIPANPLTLQTKTTARCGCVWDLEAKADNLQQPQNLIWHTGLTNTDTWQLNNLGNSQTVYVGVWDTVTYCTAERWVSIPSICQSSVWCWSTRTGAFLVSLLFIGYMLYRYWSKR